MQFCLLEALFSFILSLIIINRNNILLTLFYYHRNRNEMRFFPIFVEGVNMGKDD